ncbi:MAG: sulfatase [Kiritimatiellales bacterium]
MEKRPNIVFLHVDQLKRAAIGAYGCPYVNTPNINRLIDSSVHFERSYSSMPICVPARTSWYTGLEPEQSGITENPRWIDRDAVQPTELGTWLREKGGYNTVYAGKWHVALKPQTCGFRFLYAGNPVGEYGDTSVARAAEEFLLTYKEEKPFFLSIGLLNPHDICYWSFRYSPGKFEMASRIKDELPPFPKNYLKGPDRTGWNKEEWRFYAYSYFRFVEMVDAEIGRVFRAFEHSPQRDHTVFIFSADHGQASGEHGYLTKNTPYEHSFNVPLVIIDPKASPRCDSERLVSGLDMAPTICDYADVEPMPENNGESIKPLVRGEKIEWRDWLAAATSLLKHRVVWKGDCKLIHERSTDLIHLFNLANDPLETHDLVNDPAYAPILKELLALRDEYDAGRKYCPMALADMEKIEQERNRK